MSGATLRPILKAHGDKKSSLITDTAGGYLHIGETFARREMVDQVRTAKALVQTRKATRG